MSVRVLQLGWILGVSLLVGCGDLAPTDPVDAERTRTTPLFAPGSAFDLSPTLHEARDEWLERHTGDGPRIPEEAPEGWRPPAEPREVEVTTLTVTSGSLPAGAAELQREEINLQHGHDECDICIDCPPECTGEPPPSPPPPPPPPPPSIDIGWISWVDPRPSFRPEGELVELGSASTASEPIDQIGVQFVSSFDGWTVFVSDPMVQTNSSAVGGWWQYSAWHFGDACFYEQFGFHDWEDAFWFPDGEYRSSRASWINWNRC